MENNSLLKDYYYIPCLDDRSDLKTAKSIEIPKLCNKCSFENVIQNGYDYLFNCCQRILQPEDICAYKIHKRKQFNKHDRNNSKKINTSLSYFRNKLNILKGEINLSKDIMDTVFKVIHPNFSTTPNTIKRALYNNRHLFPFKIDIIYQYIPYFFFNCNKIKPLSLKWEEEQYLEQIFIKLLSKFEMNDESMKF